MKIMWRSLKRILSSHSRDIKKIAKSQISSKVALRQVVRKQVSFQECRTQNTPNFLILLEINLSQVSFEFKHTGFFAFRGGCMLNTTQSSWCWIFSSRSRLRKIRLLSISIFLFIVVIVILTLLKTVFWQTSIHS